MSYLSCSAGWAGTLSVAGGHTELPHTGEMRQSCGWPPKWRLASHQPPFRFRNDLESLLGRRIGHTRTSAPGADHGVGRQMIFNVPTPIRTGLDSLILTYEAYQTLYSTLCTCIPCPMRLVVECGGPSKK
eukprot:1589815-Rhodomonas_salina.1